MRGWRRGWKKGEDGVGRGGGGVAHPSLKFKVIKLCDVPLWYNISTPPTERDIFFPSISNIWA